MDKPMKKFQAWVVLAAATGINMTMGINYSWSVVKKALVTDWHWTNVEASLPYSLYTVVFSLTMILAGRMQDKMGPRAVATLGSFILGAGLLACGFSDTPLLMALAYAITAVGNSLCYSTTMPACVKWFPAEKKGLIAGIVVSGSGLASAYFSPITAWLLDHYGISSTFLMLGIFASILMLSLAQLLQNPPAAIIGPAAGNKAAVTTMVGYVPRDVDWREMIRTATFYKLWLMFLFSAAAGLMIIGHIATIAKTQANWENGFYLVVILALFNTGGRLVSGHLSDKFGRLRVMRAIFLLQAINFLLFASYGSSLLLAAGVMLTGLCYGSAFALFPVTVADFYGVKNLGGNYGLVFSAWGVAGLLGPLLAGWVVDVFGTYFIAYQVSAVLLLAALVLACTIRAEDHKVSHAGEKA
ncbi:MAG: OFA family MFS transporter [Negativicutes bacterium]|nr:OFA family MFS transporter [Negativicutes bacterium]